MGQGYEKVRVKNLLRKLDDQLLAKCQAMVKSSAIMIQYFVRKLIKKRETERKIKEEEEQRKRKTKLAKSNKRKNKHFSSIYTRMTRRENIYKKAPLQHSGTQKNVVKKFDSPTNSFRENMTPKTQENPSTPSTKQDPGSPTKSKFVSKSKFKQQKSRKMSSGSSDMSRY